jgi:hypothetical protein
MYVSFDGCPVVCTSNNYDNLFCNQAVLMVNHMMKNGLEFVKTWYVGQYFFKIDQIAF